MKIPQDKIKHFTACAILSFSVAAVESCLGAQFHNAWLAGFIAGIAIGVGKEYGDKCAEGNDWDWLDIVADSVGSIVGCSLGAVLSLI